MEKKNFEWSFNYEEQGQDPMPDDCELEVLETYVPEEGEFSNSREYLDAIIANLDAVLEETDGS